MTPAQEAYRQYLASPHWQAVRARILERAQEHCERCGRFCGRNPHEGDDGGCTDPACEFCRTYFVDGWPNDAERQGLEVHHRTYVRRGRERDADVQALCWACHEDTWDDDRR